MPRIHNLIFLFSFLIFSCNHHDKSAHHTKIKGHGYDVKIEIPDEWIEKIRHYDFKQNNATLIRELESYLKPDSLFIPDYNRDINKKEAGILNPMFTSLDGESTDELVCLIGWDKSYPSMAVFKQIQDTWYLLYLEDFYMFYSQPELYVSNNFSKNKTFYFRRVYERGSGVYSDGYSFYKLINNKVYPCLNLVNEAHIYGWELYLNQDIRMNFKFNGGNADEIWVRYFYNFFPGAIKDGDCPWCSNEDIPLIKGDDGVNYSWDNKRMIYKPDISANLNEVENLTEKKIACFGAFGNDTLFVDAFRGQINEILKTGTKQQKKILNTYLNLVKKNKTATTGEMEVKNHAGGTTFYGPKK
jgi:hypothetical protein